MTCNFKSKLNVRDTVKQKRHNGCTALGARTKFLNCRKSDERTAAGIAFHSCDAGFVKLSTKLSIKGAKTCYFSKIGSKIEK